MTAQAQINIEFNKSNYELLSMIKGNTKTNFHTSNAMLIALNFGTKTQKREMKLIYDDHNQLNYINDITAIARDYLVKDILRNMKDQELANQINKLL